MGVLVSWPPLSGSGGPNVHGPPTFYCHTAIHGLLFCRQRLNFPCTLISVPGSTLNMKNCKHERGFYKAVWLHKLHQNVWQRVSGLCPDPLESPREGREERRTEGGREVACLDPKIYDRSPPLSVARVEKLPSA